MQSFTLTRAEVVGADASTLKASIVAAAGTSRGVESILRSLERMGTDASIESFEIIEVTGRRSAGVVSPGWRVRADRGSNDRSDD